MISDPNKNFYDNFKALFFKPVDKYKDLVHHRICPSQLFERVKSIKIGLQSLDIKSKKIAQRLKLQTSKKEGIFIEKRWYLKPGCLLIGRLRQKAMKSKNHC